MMLPVQRLESGVPRVHLTWTFMPPTWTPKWPGLKRLGAEREQKVQTWSVMRDPAGPLLCVLPIRPGSLNDENARRGE
jgi:hypothetical protein